MRDIDPFSIRLFLTILEEGGIAKAAARECIVASAVSKRVGELESLFRVPLLERGVKGVTPTPAGEALQHHARMLLQAMERMHGEMSEYAQGIRGHVRVLAGSSALASHLPADMQDFMRAHPHIKIDLCENVTPAIFRSVMEGTADVGIAPDIANHESLQIHPYRTLTLAVVMPADHALSDRAELAYTDTLDFQQVELSQGSGMSALLEHAARDFARPKHTNIRVNSYETVCRMVANGMGVGVVPLFFARTHSDSFGLKFTPLNDAWARPMICLAVRDDASLPSASKAFVAHLQQRGVEERFQDSLLTSMTRHRDVGWPSMA
ncbi:hypothetical protein RD110_20560 [Rhodoferax koreense]|uniref:HTH lysR-type domain-containing protein n=1 Tax=Rhodoferax koreensis TaxID=1842727 RepID=A0A1P8K047_9BURK|nr:LysR family transcriptional regulator [Rhodoferax koreense]APW39311.1 hypothetical protein RD110_20560 [Rhodoferax koreense]